MVNIQQARMHSIIATGARRHTCLLAFSCMFENSRGDCRDVLMQPYRRATAAEERSPENAAALASLLSIVSQGLTCGHESLELVTAQALHSFIAAVGFDLGKPAATSAGVPTTSSAWTFHQQILRNSSCLDNLVAGFRHHMISFADSVCGDGAGTGEGEENTSTLRLSGEAESKGEAPPRTATATAPKPLCNATLVTIAQVLREVSESSENALSLIQRGVLDLALLALDVVPSTRDPLLPLAVELLWNILEHSAAHCYPPQASHEGGGSSTSSVSLSALVEQYRTCNALAAMGVSASFEALIRFMRRMLRQGFNNTDKDLRNDAMAFVIILCKRAENAPLFAASGLLELLLTLSVAAEARIQLPIPLSYCASTGEADQEFKLMVWALATHLARHSQFTAWADRTSGVVVGQGEECPPELQESLTEGRVVSCLHIARDLPLISTLLMYMDERVANHPFIALWTPPQRRTVELAALTLLTVLMPFLTAEFVACDGPGILARYMQRYSDDFASSPSSSTSTASGAEPDAGRVVAAARVLTAACRLASLPGGSNSGQELSPTLSQLVSTTPSTRPGVSPSTSTAVHPSAAVACLAGARGADVMCARGVDARYVELAVAGARAASTSASSFSPRQDGDLDGGEEDSEGGGEPAALPSHRNNSSNVNMSAAQAECRAASLSACRQLGHVGLIGALVEMLRSQPESDLPTLPGTSTRKLLHASSTGAGLHTVTPAALTTEGRFAARPSDVKEALLHLLAVSMWPAATQCIQAAGSSLVESLRETPLGKLCPKALSPRSPTGGDSVSSSKSEEGPSEVGGALEPPVNQELFRSAGGVGILVRILHHCVIEARAGSCSEGSLASTRPKIATTVLSALFAAVAPDPSSTRAFAAASGVTILLDFVEAAPLSCLPLALALFAHVASCEEAKGSVGAWRSDMSGVPAAILLLELWVREERRLGVQLEGGGMIQPGVTRILDATSGGSCSGDGGEASGEGVGEGTSPHTQPLAFKSLRQALNASRMYGRSTPGKSIAAFPGGYQGAVMASCDLRLRIYPCLLAIGLDNVLGQIGEYEGRAGPAFPQRCAFEVAARLPPLVLMTAWDDVRTRLAGVGVQPVKKDAKRLKKAVKGLPEVASEIRARQEEHLADKHDMLHFEQEEFVRTVFNQLEEESASKSAPPVRTPALAAATTGNLVPGDHPSTSSFHDSLSGTGGSTKFPKSPRTARGSPASPRRESGRPADGAYHVSMDERKAHLQQKAAMLSRSFVGYKPIGGTEVVYLNQVGGSATMRQDEEYNKDKEHVFEIVAPPPKLCD